MALRREPDMSRWISYYSQSLDGLRGLLPVIVALVATRVDNTEIASSIPGFGTCKSTFCQPRRVSIGRR